MSSDSINPQIGATSECASVTAAGPFNGVSNLEPAQADEPAAAQHGLWLSDHRLGASAMTDSVGLLEAVAAAVRHAQSIIMHLSSAGRQIDVQFWPRDQRYTCVTNLAGLAPGDFSRLTLIRFSSAASVEPPSPTSRPVPGSRSWPLAPLLWRLAMHIGPGELLPEIDGPVAYGIAPGPLPGGLQNIPAAQALVQRLRVQPATLDELSGRTVLGKVRVKRLLNALYLQSSLIVSRLPTAPTLHDAPGRSRTSQFARLCTSPLLGLVSLWLAIAQCAAMAPAHSTAPSAAEGWYAMARATNNLQHALAC